MFFTYQVATARDLRQGDVIVRFAEDVVIATEVDAVWFNPMRKVYQVGSDNSVGVGRNENGIHRYHAGVELFGPRDLVAFIRNPEPDTDPGPSLTSEVHYDRGTSFWTGRSLPRTD